MSKQLFANEKVMKQYLGALLCEDELVDNLEPVAKLLEQNAARLAARTYSFKT